jgi:SagB-type dehydrogenase family enzyme
MPGSKAHRYRRSPHVVCYWRDGRFLAHNYATGSVVSATTLVCDVLNFFDAWRNASELATVLPRSDPAQLRRLLKTLETLTLLQRADAPLRAEERAMSVLAPWNPAAGFFHTATKDVRMIGPSEARAFARRQARRWPVPPPIKRYRNVPKIGLPRPLAESAVARAALARRTWRRFSKRKLPLEMLATLLGLSAGVQRWVKAPIYGRIPLKTSPSGGSRHPIELYVAAWRVDGLPRGLYHYAADVHALERLPVGASQNPARYLPRNEYFARASALILLTAVFERQIWRYPYAKAYRAALIEAGHVGQTFCLLATSLGLAPFSLMTPADSALERYLGIDGITESVLYAAGVGCRPRGSEWAPLPRGTLKARPNPHLTPRRA